MRGEFYLFNFLSQQHSARLHSLSFDVAGMIKKAREFIALYEQAGYSKERVLIKVKKAITFCVVAVC